jgi:hypothetical protein
MWNDSNGGLNNDSNDGLNGELVGAQYIAPRFLQIGKVPKQKYIPNPKSN